MTRYFQNAAAAIASLLIVSIALTPVINIPATPAVIVAAPVLA